MTKTDYEKALRSEKYTGQIERYFDEHENECFHPSCAKKVLIWTKGKGRIHYMPK